MNEFPNQQAERNALTRDAWETFAPHRRRVTDLLLAAAKANATSKSALRLCVLGAGNCNDLVLAELAADFDEIHLVDLDEAALQQGIARQGLSDSSKFFIHGGIDLSATETLPAAEFDIVASVCLLSQLLEQASAAASFTSSDPRFIDLIAASRLQHVQLLLTSTLPGGTAVLVTDFVSSDTCPALRDATLAQLPRLIAAALQARNFFTGLHPGVIAQLLTNDPTFASLVADVSVTDPWLWDLGPRIYATCGFVVRRTGKLVA